MAQLAASEGTVEATRFWNDLAEGRLSFQRCAACDAAIYPPRLLCPQCLCDRLDWLTSSGSGTVYCHTSADPEGALVPLAMVIADEGFVVPTRIVGEAPEPVHIGSRVTLAAQPIGGRTLPTFRMAAAP